MASAVVAQIYNHATLGDTIGAEVLMEVDRRLTEHYNKVISNAK